MFKTLFATLMVATSMGTPLITKTEPKNLDQSAVAISGYYNFKDVMHWPQQGGSFYLTKEEEAIEAYIYYENVYYQATQIQFFWSMDYPPYYSYHIEANVYDWYDDESSTITITSTNTNEGVEDFIYLRNYNIDIQEFIVYFPGRFYYEDSRKETFSTFFTNANNEYISSYTGYFNFMTTYNGSEIDVRGNFIIDNQLYFELFDRYDSGELWARFYSTDDHGQPINKQRRIFGTANGTRVTPKDKNIYMNIPKFPESQKEQFEQIGVFQYIQDHHDTTWYEMILSTMDAPIYYLTSLMNFELFGINLFIAFSSILTLVIIITVIKKVI